MAVRPRKKKGRTSGQIASKRRKTRMKAAVRELFGPNLPGAPAQTPRLGAAARAVLSPAPPPTTRPAHIKADAPRTGLLQRLKPGALPAGAGLLRRLGPQAILFMLLQGALGTRREAKGRQKQITELQQLLAQQPSPQAAAMEQIKGVEMQGMMGRFAARQMDPLSTPLADRLQTSAPALYSTLRDRHQSPLWGDLVEGEIRIDGRTPSSADDRATRSAVEQALQESGLSMRGP